MELNVTKPRLDEVVLLISWGLFTIVVFWLATFYKFKHQINTKDRS